MRLYTFTNFYLSSIQQGIQPGHCAVDMAVKYCKLNTTAALTFWDWAKNHRTMICLNGGNAAGIRDTWNQLVRLGEQLDLPVEAFNEDYDSLDNAMTCCGIVVPSSIYDMAADLRSGQLVRCDAPAGMQHDPATQLAMLLNMYGLAK